MSEPSAQEEPMAPGKLTEVLHEPHRDRSQIDTLLRRLAHESPRKAPLSVRQHLRGMIQQQNSSRRSTGQQWLLPLAGVAAAAVIAAAAYFAVHSITNRRIHDDRALATPPASDRQPDFPVAIDIQQPVIQQAVGAAPRQPPNPTKRHRRPLAARDPQSTFVTLPFSDPTLANGTNVTIRLTLSDAELLALGVAPDENKRGQLYVADVVLGDDGLPRAIRLLPNLTAIQGGS